METALPRMQNDDPRRLRELLGRAGSMASDHDVRSTVVGISAPEGDRVFPEIIDFVVSALRMDDAIFRLTRERAVLVLSDADPERAREIMERVLGDFLDRFPMATEPNVHFGYYEVAPGGGDHSVKNVLPSLFSDAN